MSNPSRLLLTALLAGSTAAACGAVVPSATAGPTGAATSSATTSGIAHPTAATDVVLRFDEGGGFVPMEFFAAHVPIFTLYGDGTVVFVSSSASVPPAAGGIATGAPIRTVRLGEPDVQSLLEFALRDGALALARDRYDNPQVADAPTATFEIHADGDVRSVSVVALGMDRPAGPDTAVLAALTRLGTRLRDFDAGGTVPSSPFAPAAYRGILIEAGGVGGQVRPWPWSSPAPADFAVPTDPGAFQARTHGLTPAQVDALGVDGASNGIQSGLLVTGSDGVTYSLVVRPLLPDERA